MPARIDHHLNLVIPVTDEDDNEIAWVYHQSISTDVFRAYWKIIGQTMNALYADGMGFFSLRYAALMLKDLAEKQDIWEDKGKSVGVKRGLYNEIIRLTSVMLPGDKGWESILFQDAIAANKLDAGDVDTIEGAIVFFTCASFSHSTAQRSKWLGALALWNARVESLTSTEFMTSLRTSSAKESSGAIVVG